MDNNYRMYQNVKLGKNVIIEDYCIIGKPPKGKEDGELETIIGDNAVIRSHTVIYAGNLIGNDFQTGHSVIIREENIIGDDVSIGTLSCIEHHLKIGNKVRLHSQVFVPEFSVLEDGCWLGPNVVCTNARYPQGKNVKNQLVGPTIAEGAKIGANTTLMPGIRIGKHALVGAGTTIRKDIPDYKIVAGLPPKILGDIRESPEYDVPRD